MKYANIGMNTSKPEVTDISPFGIWLIYRGNEYFLDYESFPWFLNAPIKKIFAVAEESSEHLRWPELDIDLSLNSIKAPEAYPLIYEPSEEYRKNKENPSP